MAAAPAAFGAPAGARDREGAARRNRHGSPEPGLYPHFLFVFILIIAAPQYITNFVPFSGRLYVNAKPIEADDGSDRGHVQGLSSGGLRCWYGLETAGAARRARAARLRRVWPSWARQGPVNRLGGWQAKEAGAAAARAVEGVSECAPHPAHAYLTHARVHVRVTGAATRTSPCSVFNAACGRVEAVQRATSRRSSSATGASEGAALSGGIRRWALIYDWRWTRRA